MALSTDGIGKNYTDFKRLGHPGKFRGIVACAKNIVCCTKCTIFLKK